MAKDDFIEALSHFFRRRDPLAALMWHPENIEAGKSFTVPQGRIYEVYVLCPTVDAVIDENGYEMAYNGALDNRWFPADLNISGAWAFDKIDPVTGNVTYGGGSPLESQTETSYSMLPQGWRLSEKQTVSLLSGAAFKVLWRDVTNLNQ